MLRAIQLMGWPLDAIVGVDIWFDDETPAELPPMVAFKDEWDAKCLEWFGLPVTHLCAEKCSQNGVKNSSTNRLTYVDIFYRKVSPQRERENCGAAETRTAISKPLVYRGTQAGSIKGFPWRKGAWCQDRLKVNNLDRVFRDARNEGQKINIVHYIGIAADEPKRIKRHIRKKNIVLPLVQIGWDDALCGLEATYMDMLSPTYNGSCRDGCWFCHNQGVGQLRNLRKNYPDLWAKLMKIDLDSPVTFHADGHTVHDFDARFQLEDQGWVTADDPWKWSYLKNPPAKQLSLF